MKRLIVLFVLLLSGCNDGIIGTGVVYRKDCHASYRITVQSVHGTARSFYVSKEEFDRYELGDEWPQAEAKP